MTLRVKGAWKSAGGFPVKTRRVDTDTELELRPEHYQAAQFRLAPAN